MTRPLHIAALIKQVPVTESLTLGADGRLVRHGLALEMNAYCRRAVSKGVELARDSGGSCTVFTLGPPSAEDVLREAIAWGADEGVLVCDPAFAGSDTLATAKTMLAALATREFDLILVGRNSIDGETGQVGPELAQLLDLPFATGVRKMELDGAMVRAQLELDDGTQDIEVDLPAVLSVAERLCEPCKVEPEGRAAVPADRIRRLGAGDLGAGPWGDAASPTKVGAVRPMIHTRARLILDGEVDIQVAAAIEALVERGALAHGEGRATPPVPVRPKPADDATAVGVLIEPGRGEAAHELLGAADLIAGPLAASVHALCVEAGRVSELARAGADVVVELHGSRVAEDVAHELIQWTKAQRPSVVLAPSTAFGREVAARLAAATGSGLVGDAIALEVVNGRLVAAKPAFAGALVADITSTGALQVVTVRPGVLAVPSGTRDTAPEAITRVVVRRGRLRVLDERRDDDVETLARARVVIGIGTGVRPNEYETLSPLAAVLGAELGVTRKVTDKGWAPRARQIGITGRALAPRLYVAIGLSGKFNHMVGIRAAGTILALNTDPSAPVFEHCDIGLVADWHEVLPKLTDALRRVLPQEVGAG